MLRADGEIDGAKYGAILEEKAVRGSRRFGLQWDNESKHRDRDTTDWFRSKQIHVLGKSESCRPESY